MTYDDKRSPSVDTAVNLHLSQGRRRLVKGAMLATPAVMTLMSGRLAAAASAMVCQAPNSPSPTDGHTYVDPTGLPLEWGADANGITTLGYYDSSRVFHPSSAAATSSCWLSLGQAAP